jgi:hypothetical protein
MMTNDALDAIDAGRRIKVIGGDVEAAMREIGVDPESGLEVCVEGEDSADSADSADSGGEVWRVYAPTEEVSGLVGEGGVVGGSKVAVVVSKALELELERKLRAKDLVRIDFAVVTDGAAEGDEDPEARVVVWVKEQSHLWWVLVELIAGVLKQKDAQEKESEVVNEKMETEGPTAPMETEVANEKMETEVANEKMETEVPKKEKKKTESAAARHAVEMRAKAEKAAKAAEEAEAAAEEEAAVEREAERKETELKLERARQELERARKEVEGLQRKLKQQNDLERRKRAREAGGAERSEEGESRRVAARKEEKEEIVMVPDRDFKEAVGVYDGPVHNVWVERFDLPGSRGNGPVRGGVMVPESAYCSRAEAEELLALLATLATCTVTDGEVVVKGFTAVKQYDAWMEKKKFVNRTIDIDLRCKNPDGQMEPDWYQDTERVWVKMGSPELAALDKLIANERARKWQWQCPESPRSPAYRPESPRSPAYRPVRPAYAYAPSPVDTDEMD